MKSKRIIVLVLALVAGLGAAWLAKGILSANKPVKVVQPKFQTVKVLVASADIGLGSTLEPKNLKWQDWPENAVSPHIVTRRANPDAMGKFSGAIVRASFLSGEPITPRKLVIGSKGGIMSAILPKGMRAVSTKITVATGAGGFILPNDRVDVILTRSAGRRKFASDIILANVRVLAIDQQIEEQEKKGKVVVGKTATLELTPVQAELLARSDKVGTISLALRSLSDNKLNGRAAPQTVIGLGNNRRGNSVKLLRYGVATTVTPSR